MRKATIVVLQVVIAIALVGSVAVQALIAPLLWLDLGEGELLGRIFLVGVVVLGVGTLQVFGICVWLLLNRVRRGSIFSESSFLYVDVIIAAILERGCRGEPPHLTQAFENDEPDAALLALPMRAANGCRTACACR